LFYDVFVEDIFDILDIKNPSYEEMDTDDEGTGKLIPLGIYII
jgi:hypothetical protein